MTAQKLAEILMTVADPDLAEITFYLGEKSYEINEIRQFGIVPDVSITLKKVSIPVFAPIKNFRRDKQDMVKAKMEEIKKGTV